MKFHTAFFVIFFFSLSIFSWASEEALVEDAIEASEEIVDLDEAVVEQPSDAKVEQEVDAKDEMPAEVPTDEKTEEAASEETTQEVPVQTGPFIDLLGPTLYSLEMVDERHAAMKEHYTNDALRGKKVVGLYFSADWCGPCRQFTPDLVSFYNKMNARKGKKDEFEIIWVSRCRDLDSYGQYFTHMNWLALPPQEAMGQRGQMLFEKYKGKGIPHLVLLDEVGNVITIDARNKIPQDKAGIGFPWRNPLVQLYTTIVPKTVRLMVKSQIDSVKEKAMAKINTLLRKKAAA